MRFIQTKNYNKNLLLQLKTSSELDLATAGIANMTNFVTNFCGNTFEI